MDEATVETRGATHAICAGRVAAMRSKADLPAVLAKLHLSIADNGLCILVSARIGLSNSSNVIAFATGGGLSLPDRDYYTKLDTKSKTCAPRIWPTSHACTRADGRSPRWRSSTAATVCCAPRRRVRATLSVVDKRPLQAVPQNGLQIQLQALTPG
ncbi:MAG: hypothetical protein IPI80_11890 [Burkholderiales bacterium]|nr:hypothetical protein [Burkholderiales bacterium]